MEERTENKMLELAIALKEELEFYIKTDFTDDYQVFIDSKFSICGYISELSELLKEF